MRSGAVVNPDQGSAIAPIGRMLDDLEKGISEPAPAAASLLSTDPSFTTTISKSVVSFGSMDAVG
jgi:hypothetical protein